MSFIKGPGFIPSAFSLGTFTWREVVAGVARSGSSINSIIKRKRKMVLKYKKISF